MATYQTGTKAAASTTRNVLARIASSTNTDFAVKRSGSETKKGLGLSNAGGSKKNQGNLS